MPTVRKVLGQVKPSAATDTTLYTVPASTSTVVSSLVVANVGSTGDSFRVAVRINGESLTDKNFLYRDVVMDNADTFVATIGMTLAAGDVVTVRSRDGECSFTLFGEETS